MNTNSFNSHWIITCRSAYIRTVDNYCVVSNKDNISIVKGYVAAKGEPLFGGKLVTDYDCILQGHTHFEIDDRLEDTDILTLRALSMGFYGEELENEACYYILKERKLIKIF